MIENIILHIGAEKTGTTTIQHFLWENQYKLRKIGIYIPKCFDKNKHARLSLIAANENRQIVMNGLQRYRNSSGLESMRLAIKNEFDCELNNALSDIKNPPIKNIIISGEHMHSQLKSEDELFRLKSLMPKAKNTKIIFYIRRQDLAAVSLYSTGLKVSTNQGQLFFPKGKFLSYRFDYFRAYKLWTAIFGQDAVSVRIFDKKEYSGNDLIDDFCFAAGIPWCNDFKKVMSKNESLNANGFYLFEKLNALYRIEQDQDRSKYLKSLKNILATRFTNKGEIYRPSRKDALDFYDKYRESNLLLMSEAFPGRAQPLFDEDFEIYPLYQLPLGSLIDYDVITDELIKAYLDLSKK